MNLPMNLPLRSSRRQEAHSTPTRSSEKRSEPRYLGCYVRLVGSWSQCVCKSRWRLPMNLSCLVAADVRRLTLSWRVRRERDQSLVTSAATLDLSSRPQFACTSRCQLPMNQTLTRPCGHPLPSDPGYAGGFAEASGRGAGGEGSFACRFMAPILVHVMCRSKLPMNLSCFVAADVRKPALSLSKGLTLSRGVRRERDQSLVTSAA